MLAATLATSSLAGCATAYYGAMEQLGYEKRDLLVERVMDVAKSQEAAKEQFADALEAFRSVVSVDGGDLEKEYDKLSAAYDRSDEKAQKVRDRIKDIGCSLRAFPRKAGLMLPQFNGVHRLMPAIFVFMGMKVAQVPTEHRARTAGVSKYGNLKRGARGLLDLMGLYWLKKRIYKYSQRAASGSD